MKDIKNKKSIIPIVLIVVFSLISSFCLIMQADDYVWHYIYEIKECFKFQNPNGRYLTNKITYFMARYSIVRYVIFSFGLPSLIILISRLIDFEKKSGYLKYALAFLLIILIPKEMYSEVIAWVSGFTNYALSILFTLLYIFFCFKLFFDKNYKPNKLLCIGTTILGFAGALCVEHITIYNIIFGIFAVIFIYKSRKRFFLSNILYLLSSIVGIVVMFSGYDYNVIIDNGKDNISLRHIEFNFSDIFMQLYRRVIPNYSKQFFVIHIVILFCFLCIYYKSNKTDWDLSKQRYTKICMTVLVVYSIYSVFTSCFSDLLVMDTNMKIRAVETAFTFIYFVSLIYLAAALLQKNVCIRFIIYLVSTVVIVFPFLVVNPVTPRCFFSDYIFWILTAGELFFYCYENFDFFKSIYFQKFLSVAAVTLGCFMINMNISNKYCENLRIEYIKEQVENKCSVVQIIRLPYNSYVYDGLDKDNLFEENLGICYTDLMFKYYGFEVDEKNFNYLMIDMADYNRSMEG